MRAVEVPLGRMVRCSMGGMPGVRAHATARAASTVAYLKQVGREDMAVRVGFHRMAWMWVDVCSVCVLGVSGEQGAAQQGGETQCQG